MIGNDIIDHRLEVSVPPHRQRRRLRLVATQAEIRRAGCLPFPFAVCWSVKEACFKLERRLGLNRGFRPKAYQVKNLEGRWRYLKGVVAGLLGHYPFRIQTTGEYTHALVWLPGIKRPYVETLAVTGADYSSQHEDVREGMLRFGLLGPNASLEKDERGVPWINKTDHADLLPVSLSHHGHWGGICWTHPL